MADPQDILLRMQDDFSASAAADSWRTARCRCPGRHLDVADASRDRRAMSSTRCANSVGSVMLESVVTAAREPAGWAADAIWKFCCRFVDRPSDILRWEPDAPATLNTRSTCRPNR